MVTLEENKQVLNFGALESVGLLIILLGSGLEGRHHWENRCF